MSDDVHEGPVEGCDACEGHTLKVADMCLLHYVAREHSLVEVAIARAEVDAIDDEVTVDGEVVEP